MAVLRLALGSVGAGVLSAVAFAPWVARLAEAAATGASPGIGLAALGAALAVPVWAGLGAWLGRPAVGAVGGALAAAVAGALLAMPGVELWSLGELFAAVAARRTGPDVLHDVLGSSVRSLVTWSTALHWVALGLGAGAGAIGGALRRERPEPLQAVAWPLLLARAGVIVAIVGVLAGQSLDANLPGVRSPLVLSAGMLGAVLAAPFVASGVALARGDRRVYKVLAVVYALGGLLSALAWVGGPLLAAPDALRSAPGAAYLALPLVGAGLGLWRGRAGAPVRRPEWVDVAGESALFGVLVLALAFGPGGVSVGLAAALLPVGYITALSGAEPFVDPAPVVATFLAQSAGYAALTLVAGAASALVPVGLLVGIVRAFTRP